MRSCPRAAAARCGSGLASSAMRCSGARCGPSQSSRRSTDGARPGLQSLASPSRPETERRLRDSATTAGSVEEYSDHGSLQWIQVVSSSPLHLYISINRNALLSSSPSILCRSIPPAAMYSWNCRLELLIPLPNHFLIIAALISTPDLVVWSSPAWVQCKSIAAV